MSLVICNAKILNWKHLLTGELWSQASVQGYSSRSVSLEPPPPSPQGAVALMPTLRPFLSNHIFLGHREKCSCPQDPNCSLA